MDLNPDDPSTLEHLELATRAAQIAIWSWVMATNRVVVNANWRKLYGVAPDAPVTPETWSGALHPADRDLVVRQLDTAIAQHSEFDSEFRIVRPDGTVRWLIGNGRASYDPDGRVIDISGINLDVTERKLTSEALRESEERFRGMAEQLVDVLFITDAEGVITYLSPSAEGTFGWTAAEMTGRGFTDFLMEEDIPKALAGFHATANLGKPTHQLSLRMKRKDGSAFVGELNASVLLRNGAPVGTMGVIRDISERKRAEEAMLRSETLHRTLFESANDVLFLHKATAEDPSGHFVAVNGVACRRLGYTHRELLDMGPLDLAAPEARATSMRILEELKAQGQGTFDTIQVAKDGRRIPVEVSARRFEAAGETLTLSIVRDITERKQAEDALRRSEELYRGILRSAHDGFMIVGERGGILDVNDAYCRMVGYSRDELLGMSLRDLEAVESEAEIADSIRRVIETGTGRFERTHRAKDGRLVNVEINTNYLPGENKFCTFFRDVTQIKRERAEREAMLAVLRLLNSPSDARELIRSLTALLHEFTGFEAVGVRLQRDEDYPYCETRGFPPEFVEAEMHLCVQGADREALRDTSGKAALRCICGDVIRGSGKTRLTGNGSFWANNAAEMARFASGSPGRCLTAGYETIALVPLRSAGTTIGLMQFNDPRQGRLTAELVAFLERVAANVGASLEQRRTQAALAASEERYRLISENMADVIWVRDAATNRFTYVSPSVLRLRGFSAGDVMGQSLQEELTPDSLCKVAGDLPKRVAAFEAGDERARVQTCQVDQLCKDGSIVRTETVTTLLADAQGRVREILGVTRNVTERMKMEAEREKLQEQLRQGQKLESIGRLAGGIAHDFNNLLTVINGHADLMLRRLPEHDPLRQPVTEVRQAGTLAATLTQQLLAFSRNQVVQFGPQHLGRLVTETAEMLQRLVGEAVELVVRPSSGSGNVMADRGQLQQVLINLAVNARDAMPDGGSLIIETKDVELNEAYAATHPEIPAGRYVLLEVRDTGVGLDKETRSRIFEPFFTTKVEGLGTGLGLSTVYGIVRQGGGWIQVDSEVGHGTTFRIYLPRTESPVGESGANAPATGAGRGSETILVVEDQERVRALAVSVLESYGYQILEAASGADALLLAERHAGPIHLVLTDVVMPRMTGRELADRFAAQRPGTLILFMSGYVESAIIKQAISDRTVNFLAKPFDPDELAKKVREMLDAQRGRPRILVADDSAAIRKIFAQILEEEGYAVQLAGDGARALECLRAGPIELAILDLNMPGRPGVESVQEMRRVHPGIRIVLMSAAFGDGLPVHAHTLGVDAVLAKPCAPDELIAAVRGLLSRR